MWPAIFHNTQLKEMTHTAVTAMIHIHRSVWCSKKKLSIGGWLRMEGGKGLLGVSSVNRLSTCLSLLDVALTLVVSLSSFLLLHLANACCYIPRRCPHLWPIGSFWSSFECKAKPWTSYKWQVKNKVLALWVTNGILLIMLLNSFQGNYTFNCFYLKVILFGYIFIKFSYSTRPV